LSVLVPEMVKKRVTDPIPQALRILGPLSFLIEKKDFSEIEPPENGQSLGLDIGGTRDSLRGVGISAHESLTGLT
jgi:hypothetical protein